MGKKPCTKCKGLYEVAGIEYKVEKEDRKEGEKQIDVANIRKNIIK